MSEYKIFTFHSLSYGWRLEVYDLNSRLVRVFKAKELEDARAKAAKYLDRTQSSEETRPTNE
jgi:hypothetical protein